MFNTISGPVTYITITPFIHRLYLLVIGSCSLRTATRFTWHSVYACRPMNCLSLYIYSTHQILYTISRLQQTTPGSGMSDIKSWIHMRSLQLKLRTSLNITLVKQRLAGTIEAWQHHSLNNNRDNKLAGSGSGFSRKKIDGFSRPRQRC